MVVPWRPVPEDAIGVRPGVPPFTFPHGCRPRMDRPAREPKSRRHDQTYKLMFSHPPAAADLSRLLGGAAVGRGRDAGRTGAQADALAAGGGAWAGGATGRTRTATACLTCGRRSGKTCFLGTACWAGLRRWSALRGRACRGFAGAWRGGGADRSARTCAGRWRRGRRSGCGSRAGPRSELLETAENGA